MGWRQAVGRQVCGLLILVALGATGLCALAVARTPAAAAETGAVALDTNKGTIVRLSRAAATVFVADPDICDIQMKSPRLIYLLGKRPGQTTLYAVDSNEAVIANVPITVSHNLTRLTTAVRALYPETEINVFSVEGAVVLDGVVGDARTAEDIRDVAAAIAGKEGRVINRLGVAGPTQVNLRVRVAEVSRDIEKQLGINWQLLFERGSFNFLLSSVNPFAGVLADQLGLAAQAGSFDVNALLDLLDDQGLITLLAQPNLTALSGETASFLAGGEFPILVPQGDGQITIEFKKFGVSLAFTPTILGKDRINLHVRPEVSRLSNEGAINLPIGLTDSIQVPALQTRRAETTVELGSGQSFAIAGLLSNDSLHSVRKFPFLADIPILGRLFTSDRYQNKETELVIIVTPYIVKPSSLRLAAPTDGFAPPNDLERLFPGGTWKRNPLPGPASVVVPGGNRVFGNHGVVLD
jgi:pilus assembly protein CpaC